MVNGRSFRARHRCCGRCGVGSAAAVRRGCAPRGEDERPNAGFGGAEPPAAGSFRVRVRLGREAADGGGGAAYGAPAPRLGPGGRGRPPMALAQLHLEPRRLLFSESRGPRARGPVSAAVRGQGVLQHPGAPSRVRRALQVRGGLRERPPRRPHRMEVPLLRRTAAQARHRGRGARERQRPRRAQKEPRGCRALFPPSVAGEVHAVPALPRRVESELFGRFQNDLRREQEQSSQHCRSAARRIRRSLRARSAQIGEVRSEDGRRQFRARLFRRCQTSTPRRSSALPQEDNFEICKKLSCTRRKLRVEKYRRKR